MTGPGSLLSIADRSIEQLIAFIDHRRPFDAPYTDPPAAPVAVVGELTLALPHLDVIVHEGVTMTGAALVHTSLRRVWPQLTVDPAERISNLRIVAAIGSTNDDAALREVAAIARVPILNAGSAAHRPLQVLADLLVLKDLLGPLRGRSMVITDGDTGYITSWVQACVRLGINLTLLATAVAPTGLVEYANDSGIAQLFGSHLRVADHPCEALQTADIIAGDQLLPRHETAGSRIELPLDLAGSHADAGTGGAEGARTLLFHRVERAKDVVAAFVAGRC